MLIVGHQDRVAQGLHVVPDHAALHADGGDDGNFAGDRGGILEGLEVAVVGIGGGGDALVGAVLLHAVDDLAGQGRVAGGVGGISLILEGGRVVDLIALHRRGRAEGRLQVGAVGGAVGPGHAHQDVIAGGDVLGGGALDVLGGVDAVRAGGVLCGVGHDVEVLTQLVKVHAGLPGRGAGVDAEHPVGREAGGIDPGHIDLLFALGLALGGLDGAVVLDHDDGLLLGFEAVGVGGVAEDDGIGVGGVVVGLIEHIQVHHHQNIVVGSLAEDGVGLFLADILDELVIALGDRSDAAVAAIAAEDIHAALQAQGDAFGLGHLLGAPQAAGLVAQAAQDAPVGDLQAVIARLVQQAVHEGIVAAGPLAAEGIAVSVLIDGVLGHDAGGAGLAGQLEHAVEIGDQVGLKVLAREHGVAPGEAVVVAAALGRARAAVVLGEAVDGFVAPAQVVAVFVIGGLEAVDIGGGDVQGQLRVLAVGAARAAHDGRGDVHLRAQQRRDARRAILLRGLLADLRGQLGVHGGGQGKGLDQAGDVGRVDGDHGGDAIIAALSALLNGVGPLGVGRAAIGDGAGDAAAPAGLQIDQGGVVRRQGLGGEVAVPAAVGQDHGALRALHLPDQIGGALLARLAPVLIHVQRAVLVQILEGEAVVLDDVDAGEAGQAQRVAALVVDAHPAVVGDGDGVLRALARLGNVGLDDLFHHRLGGLGGRARVLVRIVVLVGVVVFAAPGVLVGIVVLIGVVVFVGVVVRGVDDLRGRGGTRGGVALRNDQLVRAVVRIDAQHDPVGVRLACCRRGLGFLLAAAKQADAQHKDQTDHLSQLDALLVFPHFLPSYPGLARTLFVAIITCRSYICLYEQ